MVGAQIALGDSGTSNFLASLHGDYEVFDRFFPAIEMNLFVPFDGGGFRYGLTDNLMVGVGADVNVLQDEDHAYGWRFLTDLVIHF